MTEPLDCIAGLAASVTRRWTRSHRGVSDTAEAERLGPILYYAFVHHGWPDNISAVERERLRKAYYTSAGHNIELLDALSEVAFELTRHGVPCIAFKGADLAKRLYPSVALRPMGDVDVYVSPKDAERAEATLQGLGYRPWTPDMTPGLSRRIRHARLYVGGPHEAAAVDLHWSLVGHSEDSRAPERDWIDRHTRRSGEPWQCLSETAHLLYLAAHMKLQHYDEEIPLLWLVDFYCLATSASDSGAMDWDELFDDAARFGWRDAVSACAHDVRERLGVELPVPLEQAAAAPRRRLHQRGARRAPERIVNEMRTLGWSGRLALARAYLFPSPEYIRFRYPPAGFVPAWAWPVGYVKRWWAVATKGCALALGALKPGTRARPLLTPRETC